MFHNGETQFLYMFMGLYKTSHMTRIWLVFFMPVSEKVSGFRSAKMPYSRDVACSPDEYWPGHLSGQANIRQARK